jgi:hypothetical protein
VNDTARRVVVLVVLALFVAGGIALGQDESEGTRAMPAAHQPIDGPVISPERAVSASWYCAEGTSSVDGRANETVIIGNLEPHEIDIATTVMPGRDLEMKTQRVRLRAFEQRRIEIDDVLRAPELGVVVETFGGRAVVEHEVEGFDDVAVGPCARTAARQWFFAEGSTERGTEDWLALFNPFDTDAIVDVTLLTEDGTEAPEAVQALVVPRRSRVSVALHDLAQRQLQVGLAIRARSGHVVAERTERFDGSDTRKGIALALGATAGAPRWRLPAGDAQDGVAASVSIANFTRRTTQVEVGLRLDGGSSPLPETVAVRRNAVVRVDVGAKVPTGTGYSVEVSSKDGTPIVVGSFGAWATPAPVTGVATTGASATTATQWAFAVARLTDDGDAVVSALNVGDAPITLQLYAYTSGDPDSPASAPARAVPAGERAVLSLGEHGIRPDQVIVIGADGPIVVGREIVGPGASMAPGVPFPGSAGRRRPG